MPKNFTGSVFISHSAKQPDHSVTQSLADALCEIGIDVWWDKDGLEGGDLFPVEILEAIIRQHFFFFVVSPCSIESKWCQRELIRATELKKDIVPLILEHVPAERSPLELAGLQHVEIFTGIPKTMPAILAALGIGQTPPSEIQEDPFSYDGHLIESIADQLPYAKTFTDSQNLVLMLEKIGLSCAKKERARQILAGMRGNHNRSLSGGVLKIDYDKVRSYLLRKWSE